MNGLFITEAKLKKTNDLNISDNFIGDNNIENQNIKSAFLIKNTKEFEEITSKMLDYIVEDETDFADLMKIEEFLKTQTIEYCEEFNIQKNDLNKKVDYLKKITLEIEEVRNKFIKFRNF
jgi:hypothetical protein